MALCSSPCIAQMTATFRGTVIDAAGGPVTGAVVSLSNALTGFKNDASTGNDGSFHFNNIPFQTYSVSVARDGFAQKTEAVSLRTNIPQELTVQLALAEHRITVEVNASDSAALVDAESTGTRAELNASAMSRMPVAPGTRGLESMLLSLPGFAADANGAIHARGAHNQMTYVIDGMPIGDQLTGAFANAVDPAIVQTVELFTGNVPAEFGSKVSGVAVITTRSGMGSGRRFSGSIQLTAGQFDTFGQITQFSGGKEKWGYYASFNTLKSNRYLDQVSLDNLHNGGNSGRAFARLDWQPAGSDQLRLNLMAGRSAFELANLRSQQANRQDQRQQMRDGSVSVGWLHTVSPSTTVDTSFSYRRSLADLLPSLRDTPVTASQSRQLSTWTAGSRWNRDSGHHNWRIGGDVQHFPVREEFTFAITHPELNSPDSSGFIPTLLAHDLSRGGAPFRFAKSRAGNLYSGFAQEALRAGALHVTLGLRYDIYRFLVSGNQLQPRVGLAYHWQKTKTVFRASYNRTYQTPPNENLLLSSSEEGTVLTPPAVRQALGRGFLAIQPERQNVYEAGLQQGFGHVLSLNAAVYHKNSRDLQDNDNFFNTGIIFPTSLLRSRTNGAELRVSVLPLRRISGSLSMTHYHTVVTPPFTGGLFLGSSAVDALSSGPFVIDHDQKLGIHGLGQYSFSRNIWASVAARYDSGLVTNPSNPEKVAQDPDFSDLLPFVDLRSAPPRVRPRTIVDTAFGYGRFRGERRLWDIVIQVSNMANRTALYNFQSIFVGTRLVQPRTLAFKLRWWF